MPAHGRRSGISPGESTLLRMKPNESHKLCLPASIPIGIVRTSSEPPMGQIPNGGHTQSDRSRLPRGSCAVLCTEYITEKWVINGYHSYRGDRKVMSFLWTSIFVYHVRISSLCTPKPCQRNFKVKVTCLLVNNKIFNNLLQF